MAGSNRTALQANYEDTIKPEMQRKRGYKNALQVPRLDKIVVNSGVGTGKDKEALQETIDTIALITGQKPVVTKARISVSNFKLRAGMDVGCRVTLRGGLMYNFLYRLINVVLPRVRDFRGIPVRGFDGAGNFNMGLPEQSMFPQIDLDKSKHTVGMNIAIITTAQSDDEAKELLAMMGMPFTK
ncbi:MAG: 50S ribosomal protein L5 [Verrucomicrobiota bacterium]